jgi:hypothetical protein
VSASPLQRPVDERNERGSMLLLVPAGILVMLVLAAIAIDSAVIFLAEREAESAASAAANDIAALAVEPGVLRDEGIYFIEPSVLAALGEPAAAAITAQLSASFVPGSVTIDLQKISDTEIQVTVTGEAVRVIGPLGTGSIRGTTTVSASAIGTALGP